MEKGPRNCSVVHFSSKLDVPSNVVQKKRVARILIFKIRPSQEILKFRHGTPLEMPSQEILKIRDGTPLEAEGILTYRKIPRNCSVWHFSSKLDVPSSVVQKKRVTRILVYKIRASQEILRIRDGTPLESPRNCSVVHFSSKLDVPSNVVQKKRVARILVFKIRPSQEILKIRDGTTLEAEGILTYRKRSSQEIQKIRDGTPLEAEGILTYRKRPSKLLVGHFSSKLDVPSNVVQKKRVARILVFKIRPSQDILKILDGTPLEAEGILTYRKRPSKLLVARIMVFKIRPSQEILKFRDGTPLEAEGILTYRKRPSKLLDVPSNAVQKKRVARILIFKIRPSQEILKIRDGTPLEAEGILTYRKRPSKLLVGHFSSKLDVPSNVVQKKRVARILVFKIRPSQEILKFRDGTPLEMSSQEIQKIRDGTPLKAEGILTYRKRPSKLLVGHFSSKLDVPSNVVQKKRVARILVFKIRPSQEILKFRDGTPLEAEGILTYRRRPSKLLGLALF
ncbi:hypothetical protein OROGR_028706 [Orobanche gracilis]